MAARMTAPFLKAAMQDAAEECGRQLAAALTERLHAENRRDLARMDAMITTGEQLLYKARYECGIRGIRLNLRTTPPPLIERRCWGGWRRPERIYHAILYQGLHHVGTTSSSSIRDLLWDVCRELRRWPVTEGPTLTITRLTPWRCMLCGAEHGPGRGHVCAP